MLVVWAVLIAILAPIAIQVGFHVAPGFGSYVVLGGSMEPAIQRGSVVYMHDSGEYEAGDIVTFHRDGTDVTHRIVERHDGGYITKGDANDEADSVVITHDQIRGELVYSVPLYGYLWVFANSQYGTISIILLGLGTVFFGGRLFVVSRKPERTSERRPEPASPQTPTDNAGVGDESPEDGEWIFPKS